MAFASTHLDKNKGKKVHDVAPYKQSPVEKTWVVDTVKPADGNSSNIKETTLSLKFKVVHTSPARESNTPEYKVEEAEAVETDSQQSAKKGPKTPPDTPPRTPTPSSVESPLRPITPQMPASPRDSPLIRTTRSRSRSNESRGSSQASQSPSPAPLPPPPLPATSVENSTTGGGKTRPDHCFKKKFLYRDKTWHNHSVSSANSGMASGVLTKYQGKFRPKGKNWDMAGACGPMLDKNPLTLTSMSADDLPVVTSANSMLDKNRAHHSFSVHPPNFSVPPMSLSLGLPDISIPPPIIARNLQLGSFMPSDIPGISKQSLSATDMSPTVNIQQISMPYYREGQQRKDSQQQQPPAQIEVDRPSQARGRARVTDPQSFSNPNKRFQGI